MPSGDNELWDRGHPRQPGDNAGSIARQTVCKWRSHRERKFFVLSLPRVCADDSVVRIEQRVPVTVAHLGGATKLIGTNMWSCRFSPTGRSAALRPTLRSAGTADLWPGSSLRGARARRGRITKQRTTIRKDVSTNGEYRLSILLTSCRAPQKLQTVSRKLYSKPTRTLSKRRSGG